MPLSDRIECRLVGRTEDSLVLAWLDAATEQTVEPMTVPRVVYDRIAGDLAAWEAMRSQLTAGPFVDLRCVLVPARTSADLLLVAGFQTGRILR